MYTSNEEFWSYSISNWWYATITGKLANANEFAAIELRLELAVCRAAVTCLSVINVYIMMRR